MSSVERRPVDQNEMLRLFDTVKRALEQQYGTSHVREIEQIDGIRETELDKEFGAKHLLVGPFLDGWDESFVLVHMNWIPIWRPENPRECYREGQGTWSVDVFDNQGPQTEKYIEGRRIYGLLKHWYKQTVTFINCEGI